MSVTFSLSERYLLRPRISFVPRRCWGWWKLQFYQHQRCARERAQRSAARPEESDKYRKSYVDAIVQYLCRYTVYYLQLNGCLHSAKALPGSSDIVWWFPLIDHSPTVDWDRPVLAKLLFCFMYLANEIDEALSWFWHSLLRPVCELKLPYCPRLPILKAEGGRREGACTSKKGASVRNNGKH